MSLAMAIVLISFFKHLRSNKGYNESTKRKRYFGHAMMFIVAFFIVYFQHAIDYILGLADPDDKYYFELVWASLPSVICKALCLSSVAFISFLTGYNMTTCKQVVGQSEYKFYEPKYLCYFGFFLLFLYLLLSGFNTHPEEDSNRGILVFLQAVILAAYTIYVYIRKDKIQSLRDFYKYLKLPLLLCFIYLVIIIATGKRGGAIKIGFMIVFIYLYLIKTKIPYLKLVILAFCGMLFMSLVGLLRFGSTINLSEALDLLSRYKTISPFTYEYATSVNTLHVAVANYPSKYAFNFGTSFIPGFSFLIPGLPHLLTMLGINYPNSEAIITELYFGGYVPDWGWGLGSSAVADAYISFGLIGVILCFIILGRFFKRLEGVFVFSNTSPYYFCVSLCCYSQILPLCRGPFFIMFLSLSYSVLFIWLFQKK